jgi:probable rRNA maturation factor
MSPSLDIRVSSRLWRNLPGARAIARRAIAAAIAESGVRLADAAEISLALSDDSEVRALNARWRGLDRPTNVLSFPAAPPERLSRAPVVGDVIVAYETMAREAEGEGKSPADHFRHLIVHGALHLFGYDHQGDGKAEAMEALERRILARLGVADPYAAEAPAA